MNFNTNESEQNSSQFSTLTLHIDKLLITIANRNRFLFIRGLSTIHYTLWMVMIKSPPTLIFTRTPEIIAPSSMVSVPLLV